MGDIEKKFSEWIPKMLEKVPPAIVDTNDVTVGAMDAIHRESMAAVDAAYKQHMPAVALVDASVMAGITLGFLFREYLAQMEDLPL